MAIILRHKINEYTELAIWKIEESEDWLLSQLQLDETEKAHYKKIKCIKRAKQWLAGRVLLRSLINIPDFIEVIIDEHNKPHFKSLPYHFSLSNTAGYAVAILSNKGAVGIDMEGIKPKIESLKHKFLNDSELKFIDTEYTINHLSICWAAKEAVYKRYGKKGISLKNNILLSQFEYNSNGLLKAQLTNNEYVDNFIVHYQEWNGFIISFTY